MTAPDLIREMAIYIASKHETANKCTSRRTYSGTDLQNYIIPSKARITSSTFLIVMALIRTTMSPGTIRRCRSRYGPWKTPRSSGDVAFTTIAPFVAHTTSCVLVQQTDYAVSRLPNQLSTFLSLHHHYTDAIIYYLHQQL